jgi:hypothetical protein
MAFDPDEYLAKAAPAPAGFDPDAYLATPPPAPPPDKYQAAAIAERERLRAAKVPLPEGLTRRVSSGPLLGWGDEIGAAMTTPFEMARHGTWDPREGYKYGKAREVLASKAADAKTGVVGDVAEVVGGLATLPGNVIARQASAALGGGRAARMAGYGAEGALLGGVQGAGTAETVADIPNDAARAALLSGAISAPFGLAANVARRSTAAVPTEAELSTLGARDARARDRLPVSYDLDRVAARMQDVADATRRKYGRDAPQTADTLRDRIAEAQTDVAAARALNPNPPGAVATPGQTGAPNPWSAVATPRDITSLRREIYEGSATGSPTDERAATVAGKVVGRILSRPDPSMLAPGVSMRDAITAAQLDARRRGNFAAGYRSKAVTDQVEAARNTAGGQHSGLNFENILRQNLNRARKNEAFGGFNQAETAGAEGLIRGTASANKLREIGNLLGGGGGLGRMVAMGGGAGGGALTSYLTGGDPWAGAAAGFGLGTTGRVLRNIGNARMERATNAFAEDLRRRSPEYLRRLAAAPTEIGPGLTSSTARAAKQLLTIGGEGAIRDAIAKALLFQTTGKRELPRVYSEPEEKR